MGNIAEATPHGFTMDGRKHLSMTGAVNVDNFEDTKISIETVLGNMELKGRDMHIIKFDTQAGELVIEGEFDSMEYTNATRGKGGFISKLFG